MQCCWLSFMLVESFSFLQKFKIPFLQKFKIPFEIRFMTFSQKKMPKYLENKSLGTKIDYFAQFIIFADISGYRQSQISLLICLLFSVGKLQTQK